MLSRITPILILLGIIIALGAICLCTGCKGRSGKADQMNSGIAPPMGGPKPQSMSPSRLERLRDRIGTVQLGEDMESVVAIVGHPDETETVGPKRVHDAEEDLQVLVYNVSLVGSERGNTGDRTVELWFDHSRRLVSISSNVEGIESRTK
jgi:hypothetical protein